MTVEQTTTDKPQQQQQVCPNCGRCPCCGRPYPQSYYPAPYPYYPGYWYVDYQNPTVIW